MKILLIVFALAFIAPQAFGQTNNVPEHDEHRYGDKISQEGIPVALSDLVEKKQFDKLSLATAKVVDVCSVTGCWMILKDGDTEVRVSFKNYGFFVPSSLVNKPVVIQGMLKEEIVTEADRRHYAEDAGASEEEISIIVGDSKEYVFEATGVEAR